jgi:hypothetical protein
MTEIVKLAGQNCPTVGGSFKCGNWVSIQICVPVPIGSAHHRDTMLLPVFAKIDGERLIELTTHEPGCFCSGNSFLSIPETSNVPAGGLCPSGIE